MAPRKRNFTALKIVLAVIIAVLVALCAYTAKLCVDLVRSPAEPLPTDSLLEDRTDLDPGEDAEKGGLFQDEEEERPTDPPSPLPLPSAPRATC